MSFCPFLCHCMPYHRLYGFPWFFLPCFGKTSFVLLILLWQCLWIMVWGTWSFPLGLLVQKCLAVAMMPFWSSLTSTSLRLWWCDICASSSSSVWYRNVPGGHQCWVWLLNHVFMAPLFSLNCYCSSCNKDRRIFSSIFALIISSSVDL